MNKDKLTLLLASLVTLMLGPGTGHLIIKEWKKAIFFTVVIFWLKDQKESEIRQLFFNLSPCDVTQHWLKPSAMGY